MDLIDSIVGTLEVAGIMANKQMKETNNKEVKQNAKLR